MKAGKDIVALSVPFAAGIVAGALAWHGLQAQAGTAAGLRASCFLSCLCVSLLLFGGLAATLRRSVRRIEVLQALFFLTGVFCLFTRKFSAPAAGNSAFMARMQDLAAATGGLLEDVGFRSPDTAPLLKALIFGDKSTLDREVLAAFRTSGAAHILALSGLHLGIIYLVLSKLLSPLGKSRPARLLKSVIVLAVMGIHVLATGASPSLTRAYIFMLLNEAATLLSRERKLTQVLCSALFLQLALMPEAVESVGFQLSYLAMAGIALIYPQLRKWMPEDEKKMWWEGTGFPEDGMGMPEEGAARPEDRRGRTGTAGKWKFSGFRWRFPLMRKIWELAALSISCQIFTAPAVWYYFGTFPKYFLITNLTALPLTGVTITAGMAATALEAAGRCPDFLIRLCDLLVRLLEGSVEIIAGL